MPAHSELVHKVVIANRILFNLGILDGFGHVSARLSPGSNQFLLSSNRAPGLVCAEDVLIYGEDGEPVEPTDKRSYLERFIHSEIFNARPDVMAIVHSHSASVIPFGVTDVPFKPIYHMSGFLGEGVGKFEIRDAVGEDNDLLIRDTYLGKALAKSLGKYHCVLMRGHGATLVGPSVEVAVYRAYYAEMNAKLQISALGIGGNVTYLAEQEAKNAMTTNEGQIKRTWDLWAGQIEL